MLGAIGVLVVGLVLGGRALQIASSQPTASPVATVFLQPLPTTGFMDACAGDLILSPVVLASTATGIVGRLSNGFTIKLFWPPGFSAIYDPLFSRVLTDRGEVFTTAGEDISGHLDGGKWNGMNVCPAGDSIYIYP